MTLLWLFWQILISYCKFLMPRPLKWSILGAHTIILSKNIHKGTKKDYVWFEFLWIRRYLVCFSFPSEKRKLFCFGIIFGQLFPTKSLLDPIQYYSYKPSTIPFYYHFQMYPFTNKFIFYKCALILAAQAKFNKK